MTNHQITRRVPLVDPPVAHVLGEKYDVGMGYMTLRLVEKRAVAHDGRLLRPWPRRLSTEKYTLLWPPNGQGNVQLGRSAHVWHSVGDAVDLSERTRGPVVVYGIVYERNRH